METRLSPDMLLCISDEPRELLSPLFWVSGTGIICAFGFHVGRGEAGRRGRRWRSLRLRRLRLVGLQRKHCRVAGDACVDLVGLELEGEDGQLGRAGQKAFALLMSDD